LLCSTCCMPGVVVLQCADRCPDTSRLQSRSTHLLTRVCHAPPAPNPCCCSVFERRGDTSGPQASLSQLLPRLPCSACCKSVLLQCAERRADTSRPQATHPAPPGQVQEPCFYPEASTAAATPTCSTQCSGPGLSSSWPQVK
jgi:hypothetical protein